MPETKPALVLVVDDEATVIRAVTAALALSGFRVLVAENGAAALDLFLSAPEEIDMVLADVMMPLMDGQELAKRILEIRPHTKIVLMTGYSEAVVLRRNGVKLPLLRKPFLPADLMRVVEAQLNPPTANA
jgi:CheY-like chemotaxis protein